eukprot:m.154319 g.154319  ORF g.154319 m.154319 type:complete len:460 (-) comp17495_c0_seq4:45-1424(-)
MEPMMKGQDRGCGGVAVALAAGVFIALSACVNALQAEDVAMTPPMGWNSWDSFQGDLTESQLYATATAVQKYLLPSGYDTVTIDEFWYPDDGTTAKSIDAYGRAIPDISKWPSAAGGKGLLPVAQHIHAMNLSLGIHVMHGVPAAALNSTATVQGTSYLVSSLSTGESCPWNKAWYRINMTAPGAQEYLDSIYSLYAGWEVDFIKNDCVFGQNYSPVTLSNIQGAREAMDKAGRPMTYSLSPGFSAKGSAAAPLAVAGVQPLVNIYRVTQDWHGWQGADGVPGWPNHFGLANLLTKDIGAAGAHGKSWPDLDMLHPFDDMPSFRMQQTLWCIARSPLIYGGDITKETAASPRIEAMTNGEVLAMHKSSSSNKQVFRTNDSAVWYAAGDSGQHYVALFRLLGQGNVTVTLKQLGISANSVKVRDAWKHQDMGSVTDQLSMPLSACSKHSSGECAALLVLT